MAAESLKPPSEALATDRFPKKYVSPTRLARISAYHTGEPYFGKSGNNRFDAPGAATGTPEFGVCYLGTSLELAMAESILHDEIPVNGAFTITRTQIEGRFALYFGGLPLHLLDLTGPLLKRLGGNAGLAGTTDYRLTQQWARAVYDNPAGYDGFLYMSRHLNTKRAVALFDRAKSKIQLASYSPLANAVGFKAAVKRFGIQFT
ncbi:RES family NAD+ phosphorylase [Massilia sp. LXY-6]|uniref:RES family NAD+ phosphorylase n=1 Tax=Massilia sp. LXY-6 TaxID=3379823 RepID=UPI003EDFEC29